MDFGGFCCYSRCRYFRGLLTGVCTCYYYYYYYYYYYCCCCCCCSLLIVITTITTTTRVSWQFFRATEHISNLHCFRSNKVYYPSHAIINLLCECGVIWIKSDGAFLINKQTKQTNRQTHTCTQH